MIGCQITVRSIGATPRLGRPLTHGRTAREIPVTAPPAVSRGDITNRKDKHGHATDDCRCVEATTHESAITASAESGKRRGICALVDNNPCLHVDIGRSCRADEDGTPRQRPTLGGTQSGRE